VRQLRTGRVMMARVGWHDLPDLRALKADARSYAMMLGGVRSATQVAEELAEDIALWGSLGVGIWSVREAETGLFVGITGFMRRPDRLGIALRFAFWPHARGRGLAREAAGAALWHAHESVGLRRIVAVAREANVSSRLVLGAIGMRECDQFEQHGHAMLLYESKRDEPPAGPPLSG
jgi:RimJ/RimL family protein N-acetyltransferase